MDIHWQSRIALPLVALAVLSLLSGYAAADPASAVPPTVGSSDGVENRSLPRMQAPGITQQPRPAAIYQPNASMPVFPQPFDVQGPEARSLGFAVTQPGPIGVNVQSSGTPIEVTLIGPASAPVKQRGSGQVLLTAQATAQDIQRSPFWQVQVRAWCEDDCRKAGKPVQSNGSVTVQHPPADPRLVQAAMNAARAHAEATRAQQEAAAAQDAARLTMQMDADLQKRNADLRQQDAQRRAAMLSPLQPALNQMRAHAGAIRTRGVDGSDAAGAGVETRAVSPGSSSAAAKQRFKISPADRAATMQQQAPVSMSQASTAPAAGAASTEAAPPPAPNPVIASLSVPRGQPGDPIMLNGSGFGTTGGEVRFVVGPGQNMAIPAGNVVWTDTQIFATVPGERGGLTAFNGTVYIKRADQKVSNLMPFAFNPLVQRRQIISLPVDRVLDELNSVKIYLGEGPGLTIFRNNFDCWSGHWGHDRLFTNTRLLNGWRVSQMPLIYYPRPSRQEGSAIIMDSRVGTDWPYVDVRWSVNLGFGCAGAMDYGIALYIEGPLGTKDGVVLK